MWHYSVQGLPSASITAGCRELLPHVFTFTAKAAVIFCGTICFQNETRQLTGALPYAVRTFLPVRDVAMAQPVAP